MHDCAFAAAVRPARQVILKLPMRPYSLGHEIVLLGQGNPLVTLTREGFNGLPLIQQLQAIGQAAWTCSNTWRENQGQPLLWLKSKIWERNNRRSDFALAIADFRNYREAGCSYPPTPTAEADTIANGDESGKGREIGGPFLARLYNHIAALPDREILVHGSSAFDFPMGFATFLYFSHLEAEGELKIENSKEAQIREELIGHKKALAAEKAKEATCPA